MRTVVFGVLYFLVCLGLAGVLHVFVSWLFNDIVGLLCTAVFLVACAVHGVRTLGALHRKTRDARRQLKEIDDRWTPAGIEAQVLGMIEERRNPHARKPRRDLDLTRAHGGQACPFCGEDVYMRQDRQSFACIGCSCRYTILSDKTGDFYFCEGRRMEVDEARKRFVLPEGQAADQFPTETVMIDKKPGRHAT